MQCDGTPASTWVWYRSSCLCFLWLTISCSLLFRIWVLEGIRLFVPELHLVCVLQPLNEELHALLDLTILGSSACSDVANAKFWSWLSLGASFPTFDCQLGGPSSLRPSSMSWGGWLQCPFFFLDLEVMKFTWKWKRFLPKFVNLF